MENNRLYTLLALAGTTPFVACAVLAGALFLDETVSPSVYVGLSLILSGIAVSELGARFNEMVRFRRQAAMRTGTVRGKA